MCDFELAETAVNFEITIFSLIRLQVCLLKWSITAVVSLALMPSVAADTASPVASN